MVQNWGLVSQLMYRRMGTALQILVDQKIGTSNGKDRYLSELISLTLGKGRLLPRPGQHL